MSDQIFRWDFDFGQTKKLDSDEDDEFVENVVEEKESKKKEFDADRHLEDIIGL